MFWLFFCFFLLFLDVYYHVLAAFTSAFRRRINQIKSYFVKLKGIYTTTKSNCLNTAPYWCYLVCRWKLLHRQNEKKYKSSTHDVWTWISWSSMHIISASRCGHDLPPTQARTVLKAQLSIPFSIIFCSSLFGGEGRPMTVGLSSLTARLSPTRCSRIMLYWIVGLSVAGLSETGPCGSVEAAFGALAEAAMFLNDRRLAGKCTPLRAVADSSRVKLFRNRNGTAHNCFVD